ncbi:MAG: extracellular solute-binding protein [Alphaproteobacteria bacterium]|nr:extracellular solute-binding protein [Alphaproteobacteria bacterium]
MSGAAAGLAAPRIARAAEKLVIIGHAVHRTAATSGPGGDVTEGWRRANNVEIEWLTFGVEATNERALKEANLAQGNADLVFLLDRYTGPQFTALFEDLVPWMARDPIPDFAEFPHGMLAAHRFGAIQAAMPFRHATHGLHVNRTFLAERGIATPPRTLDDTMAAIEKLSFTRDGGRVYGLVINMDDPSTPIDWVRAYGGDFITPDYKVVVDQPGAVRAMAAIRDLFRRNLMPRNVVNMKTEDVITFMQQGRGAMTNQPFNRTFNYNDAKASKFPGQFDVLPLPTGIDGKPIPAKTSVWAMAIPRNARRKELSWSLLRHLSLPESTVLEAMNGNGPVRPSAYADPRVMKVVPYAAAEAEALKSARLVVPGFANAAKAMDMFIEEMGAVLLGTKEPQAAMADLAGRVRPLLPA